MKDFLSRLLGLGFCVATVAGLLPDARAGDWPQFLGPTRNGVSTESITRRFPAQGPTRVWRIPVGHGFSAPVVAAGKVILFHRRDGKESLEAFDLKSGKSLWTSPHTATYEDDFGFDDGPRATPTIDDGRVLGLGADGVLECADFETGKRIWSVDARRDLGAGKGFFGFACSPLVMAKLVLVNLGGRDGAGIAAFEVETGKLAWKSTDHEAGYAAPVSAEVAGRQLAVFFTRAGVVGLNPTDGQVQFDFPWRARQSASVNAATPVVDGERLFVSASYNTGAVLLRLKANGVEKVWSGDDILSNHYATSVPGGGHLYGFDGRQESGTRLRCVELATGKIAWTREGIPAGSILRAGETLLLLLETGELVLVDASPAKYTELARAQVLGRGTRAMPALSGGFLLARDSNQLICLDLQPEKH